jgi:hypothetical protein
MAEEWGDDSCQGKRFFSSRQHPDQLLGLPQLLIQRYHVKWPEHGADHSSSSSSEIKNAWSYAPACSCMFMAWCIINLSTDTALLCAFTPRSPSHFSPLHPLLPPLWSLGHPWNALFQFSFLIVTQLVGLFGWSISPSPIQDNTNAEYIHALSGIRTHNPNVQARKDSWCLRLHGHCDWPYLYQCNDISVVSAHRNGNKNSFLCMLLQVQHWRWRQL